MREINEITQDPVDSLGARVLSPGVGLFLASFLSLFLELLLIRWVPSQVRVVAYYSNLMLISAFLGLGCGMLLARRSFGLYKWFGPFLMVFVGFVLVVKDITFRQGPDELRFLFEVSTSPTTIPIVIIFVLNALVFVPLGELIGICFQQMPPLQAYSWDLGGAIVGTLLFGMFSYFWFSPVGGFIISMAVYLVTSRGRYRFLIITALPFIVVLTMVGRGTDKTTVWSPYNHLSITELYPKGERAVSGPLSNIRTVVDPPFYHVRVNHAGYMYIGTIDRRRYKKTHQLLFKLAEQYSLPHRIRPDAQDVLVVGSGGGMDVEAALLYGAKRVDAVEIDPAIIRIGHQYSPAQSYENPRVSVYNTDARAFFKQAHEQYDMVVFGFLDSQGLFSQMSSVRLDGYVYTRESFQEAFDLLKRGGLLSISFFSSGKLWLLDRLVTMVHSATGTIPLVYVSPNWNVVILAGKGFVPKGPKSFVDFERTNWVVAGIPEATDDWPYLYLMRRSIPSDYLVNIGVLLAISLLFVFFSSGKERKGLDLHFFFLGAGFLLLETKSITAISLYFGTTWFVSMVVILGVLIMVFLANLAASQLKRFSLIVYLPLIASVTFLCLFPTQHVLVWSFFWRLLFSLVIIPLPIFFAGLIFSTTFRESEDPSFAFGSNLLGAMVGGFAEYLGMITGMKALLLVVIVFYLASLLVRLRAANALPSSA